MTEKPPALESFLSEVSEREGKATKGPWQVERERSVYGGPAFLTAVVPWAPDTWGTEGPTWEAWDAMMEEVETLLGVAPDAGL